MSKNQNKAFWSIYIGFSITVTLFFYSESVLQNLDLGTSIILTIIYLLCAIPIYLYVKKGGDKIDRWFK